MRLGAEKTVGWVCVNSRMTSIQRGFIVKRPQDEKEESCTSIKTNWVMKEESKSQRDWGHNESKKGRTFYYLHLIVRLWYHFLCSVRTLSSEHSSISKAAFLSLKSGFKTTWQWWRASLLGLHYYRWGTMWMGWVY